MELVNNDGVVTNDLYCQIKKLRNEIGKIDLNNKNMENSDAIKILKFMKLLLVSEYSISFEAYKIYHRLIMSNDAYGEFAQHLERIRVFAIDEAEYKNKQDELRVIIKCKKNIL